MNVLNCLWKCDVVSNEIVIFFFCRNTMPQTRSCFDSVVEIIFLKFTRRDEFIVVLYITTFLSLQLYTGCFVLEIFFTFRWVTIIALTANILCLHSYIFNVIYNLSTRNIKSIQENAFYEGAIHGSFIIYLTISVALWFAGCGVPGLFPERTK